MVPGYWAVRGEGVECMGKRSRGEFQGQIICMYET